MSKLNPESNNPRITKQIIDSDIKTREMNLKVGFLGKFFGSNESTPIYIVGIISLILVVFCCIYSFLPDNYRSPSLSPESIWVTILPVITTIVGYLFGVNSKKDS